MCVNFSKKLGGGARERQHGRVQLVERSFTALLQKLRERFKKGMEGGFLERQGKSDSERSGLLGHEGKLRDAYRHRIRIAIQSLFRRRQPVFLFSVNHIMGVLSGER